MPFLVFLIEIHSVVLRWLMLMLAHHSDMQHPWCEIHRYYMMGGSSSGLGGRAGRDGVGSADAARRRRQAASRGLFDFSSEAHSGGDPPWPSLGIGGVGRTSGEEVSGASQVRLTRYMCQGLCCASRCMRPVVPRVAGLQSQGPAHDIRCLVDPSPSAVSGIASRSHDVDPSSETPGSTRARIS